MDKIIVTFPVVLTFAPLSTRYSTISAWPLEAAHLRGVHPSCNMCFVWQLVKCICTYINCKPWTSRKVILIKVLWLIYLPSQRWSNLLHVPQNTELCLYAHCKQHISKESSRPTRQTLTCRSNGPVKTLWIVKIKHKINNHIIMHVVYHANLSLTHHFSFN